MRVKGRGSPDVHRTVDERLFDGIVADVNPLQFNVLSLGELGEDPLDEFPLKGAMSDPDRPFEIGVQ